MSEQSLLAHAPFRNLWLANTVSQLGDSLYYVTNAFMINRITGQASMVGFNGALETLPFFVLGPYAGVLADRIDRRKILLASDVLCALLLFVLAAVVVITPQTPVAAIFITSLLAACARTFFHPAKNAAVPRVAPEGRVLEANAFSSMTFNFTLMAGLALSATILGILYTSSTENFYVLSILINAFSFLGSAAFVAKLPVIEPDREKPDVEAHVFQDVKEGLRYLSGRHDLKVLFSIGLISSLLIAPFFPVYVKANELWFGNKPQTLTWFECDFFVGMLVAGAFVAKRKLRSVGWGNILGLAGCGISVGLMAYLRTVEWWLFLNFLAGIALPFAWIPTDTFLQVSVPDQFRGRVQSLKTMLTNGTQPLGLVFGGVIIDKLGLIVTILIMGGGTILATFPGLFDRHFRQLKVEEEKATKPESQK